MYQDLYYIVLTAKVCIKQYSADTRCASSKMIKLLRPIIRVETSLDKS